MGKFLKIQDLQELSHLKHKTNIGKYTWLERSSTKNIKGLETGLVYVGYSFQAYHVYSQSQCPLYQCPGASGALAGAGASAGDVRDMGSIPGFGRSLE